MLTKKQRKIIEEYVNPRYYDLNKLMRYLELHDIVGNEVFQYCDKRSDGRDVPTYAKWLDDEGVFLPLSVESFIRRVPFYFFIMDIDKDYHGLTDQQKYFGHLVFLDPHTFGNYDNVSESAEALFSALEYLFYDLHLPLYKIFTYWHDQDNSFHRNIFYDWYKYLLLCEGDQSIDFYPERFITTYNETRERKGLDPIIYTVDEMLTDDYYYRQGPKFIFEGAFPCDQSGKPIMKWIGIRAKNIRQVKCDCEKSQRGHLTIDITPTSVIHLLNVYNRKDDQEDTWYQIYAGPLCMDFDYTMLKYKRKQLKLTQQEVADAIGATVRTYQKWENGETTPDGHYLLRLMNWLDISDVQYAIKYTDV